MKYNGRMDCCADKDIVLCLEKGHLCRHQLGTYLLLVLLLVSGYKSMYVHFRVYMYIRTTLDTQVDFLIYMKMNGVVQCNWSPWWCTK